jgi:hypothetical protein
MALMSGKEHATTKATSPNPTLQPLADVDQTSSPSMISSRSLRNHVHTNTGSRGRLWTPATTASFSLSFTTTTSCLLCGCQCSSPPPPIFSPTVCFYNSPAGALLRAEPAALPPQGRWHRCR